MVTPQQWQAIKDILQHTLTTATYRRWLVRAEPLPSPNGRLHIGVPNAETAEWCNQRLMQPVRRAVMQVTGTADLPDIVFEVMASPTGESPVAAPDAPGIANFDFLPVWRKTGYNQLPHYVTRFWIPYLKPAAFATWNALAARDTRSVQYPENRWTLPRQFTYRQLARDIGAASHKVISGRKEECGISRKYRLDGTPITDVCARCLHPIHRLSPGTDGDNRCKYWRPGTLEVLYREQLLALDVHHPPGDNLPTFSLSVYRILPILTPTQVATLPAAIRREHRHWLSKHETLLRLSAADWEAITTPTLVPHQPG